VIPCPHHLVASWTGAQHLVGKNILAVFEPAP
jgi:hypothetical protein